MQPEPLLWGFPSIWPKLKIWQFFFFFFFSFVIIYLTRIRPRKTEQVWIAALLVRLYLDSICPATQEFVVEKLKDSPLVGARSESFYGWHHTHSVQVWYTVNGITEPFTIRLLLCHSFTQTTVRQDCVEMLFIYFFTTKGWQVNRLATPLF